MLIDLEQQLHLLRTLDMLTVPQGDRRAFLRLASLVPLGAVAAVSPSLSTFPSGLKVAEVRAFAVRRAVFARVTADDGTSGWGECGHNGGPLVAEVVNRELRALVAGCDILDADPTWARMYFAADELGPSGLAAQAIAGVDCALWDLRGKLLGQPVCRLLGGVHRERIPLYGSFSRDKGGGKFMTPAECAARGEELVAEGFQTIKIRLGIREEAADPDPDPAVPTVREVRRAVGDRVELYVDANNGYSATRAIEVGRRLAGEFGVRLLEEPVAAYQYESLARVAGALDIPVAAGEHEYTKWQFRDLMLQGGVDVINPDVSKLAGLTEAMKVAALAEVFDTPVVVHNARPTLLTAAHLHFVAACRMARGPQEHPGSRRLAELWQFFRNRLEVRDGHAQVPSLPGLGLEVDEAAVMKAELR